MTRDVTEQGRSPEQLAYLLALLENTDDAIIVADREWHITAWNRGAERMYGWTAEEAVGRHPTFVRVQWRDEQAAEDRLQQLSEFGRWRAEGVAERKDGSKVWIELIIVALPDAQGAPTGYLGIHRDVTERKRVEEQLRYHASLMDNVEDGVIATDAEDFRILAWNRGAERLYGFSAEEVLGRSAREVASYPGDQARLTLERELLDTGRTQVEFQAVRKDGSPIEVELLAVAMTDETGRASGYLGIHRDVTEHRRTQAALETRARQQASLAELTLRNLAAGDLQALLNDSVALVARTLQVDLATIGEKLPGEQGVAWRAAHGWSAEALAQAPPSSADARSLVGYALLASEPVISDDMRTDERFGISELFAERHPVSAAVVVIPGDRKPFGVLVAAARHRRSFTPLDVDLMTAVANVIGVAVERARVTERMEEVRGNLRTRIARDLHDDALRELTDALALAATARSAADEDEAARWDGLIAVLQRVGQHLRGAVYDLRVTEDEDRDFAALLSDLVDVQAGKAIGCGVQFSGASAISPGSLGRRGTEVLRIVREAITNARLHSGAALISVDAGASTADVLRLEVTDDGQWPDRAAEASTQRGAGIAGMFERADELGAELRIEGRPEGGTEVSLELRFGEMKGGTR